MRYAKEQRHPNTEKSATEAFGSGRTIWKGTYGFCRSIAPNYRGYRHILIVVDSTTLYVEAFPTKSTTAEEVAEILYKEIIARYGVMRELLTDQGSSFKNKLIAQLCKLLNIKHRFSSPHHPQTDGKAERMVQTVIRSLKLICDTQTVGRKVNTSSDVV